jgi:hypothetical protein
MMTPIEKLRMMAGAYEPGLAAKAEAEVDSMLQRAMREKGASAAYPIEAVRAIAIGIWIHGYITGAAE